VQPKAKDDTKKDVVKKDVVKKDVVKNAGVLDADVPRAGTTDYAAMEKRANEALSPAERDIYSGKSSPVKSVEENIDLIKAMEAKFMDPKLTEARQSDRAEAMKSRASISDELSRRDLAARQDMWLRVGSMPGPILANVARSMIEQHKDELENSKWGRDALKSSNEIIAKLNDSDYLLQQGHINKGMDLHAEQVKNLQKLTELIDNKLNRSVQTQATMRGQDLTSKEAAQRNKLGYAQLDVEKQKVELTPSKADTQAERSRDSLITRALSAYKDDPNADIKARQFMLANLSPKEKKILGYDESAEPVSDKWGPMSVSNNKSKDN
jgi:hypothetical protein